MDPTFRRPALVIVPMVVAAALLLLSPGHVAAAGGASDASVVYLKRVSASEMHVLMPIRYTRDVPLLPLWQVHVFRTEAGLLPLGAWSWMSVHCTSAVSVRDDPTNWHVWGPPDWQLESGSWHPASGTGADDGETAAVSSAWFLQSLQPDSSAHIDVPVPPDWVGGSIDM